LGIPNIKEKTRYNKRSNLSDFWRWLLRRGVINQAQMPMFPEIPFDLGYRKVTDWETQTQIIAEIERISTNPKIAFGVELLATYPALRPGDLAKINEENIDLKYGEILIHDPTKRKNQFKQILLIQEHIEKFELLKQKYPGFPKLQFFRHIQGGRGTKPDQPFGAKMFYKRWIEACQNLKIDGLDLYAGTRHTSITEIARRHGENKAIKTSGHNTNKAFERYCRVQDHTALEMAKARAESVKIGGNVIDIRTLKNKK
jgi:integrase